MKNIATGKTSQDITPFNFFNNKQTQQINHQILEFDGIE